MKRFITIILTLTVMISCCTCGRAFEEPVDPFTVAFDEHTRFGYQDMDYLLTMIEEQNNLKSAAHKMAEGARELGYEEDNKIIKLAKEAWHTADTNQKKYQECYNILQDKWIEKETEYPEACYIWTYLKSLGYNDQVAAGILGNIMAEVGGNTLTLDVEAYGKGFYGICQWSRTYEDVWGTDLEFQCDFLRDTIEYEIDTFGFCFAKNFDYESFLDLANPEDAALAFAESYERCASSTNKVRQENAIKAYNYFVG